MLTSLHQWLLVNNSLVLFLYGQVFFVLGIVILLQSRQYSRLKLAHRLPWLAGFGLLHGFNEWGDLFIPIQAQYLDVVIIDLLRTFQLILLALSFFCLLQFGLELFRPWPQKLQWLRFIPFILLMIWVIIPFTTNLIATPSIASWQNKANAFARYLLCIPGGLIAGYGLKKQVNEQIRHLGEKKIERTLNIAAGALIIYGILGGIIVPASDFFPGRWLNVDTFTQLFFFPPAIFRSIDGLVLTTAIIRLLEIFNKETQNTIHQMEERLIIFKERERIVRDLHDGALQQVYAAGLLAQSLQKKVPKPLSDNVHQLVETITQSISQLREFLSQLQLEIDQIDVLSVLKMNIDEFQRVIPVETRWEIKQHPHFTPQQANHLIAFTREALSNAVRHSQTDHIEIFITCAHKILRLDIQDFGQGFPDIIDPGYGLRNMHDRAKLLDAKLNIQSTAQKGTTISLSIPIKE